MRIVCSKRIYGKEKPGPFVFGKPVLFTLGLGLTTPYSLGILVWNFYQTFFTVSTEFWLRFELQIRPTRLAINFLFITARTERKVHCAKLFDFFRGRILIRLTWNMSRFVPTTVEILTWNFRKTLFQENFSEILCKPRRSSTETYEIPPYFLKFYSASVLRWKNSHKYEARPLKNHKKKIPGRKVRTFCFRKTSFVHPRSGTCYALLLGYFSLKFLPHVLHCVYWVLTEIWAPDSYHKIGNKFFVHHCQDWKEGLCVCGTVWFFLLANTHPFDLKFVTICPKFSGDSYVEFQEKTISG